MPVEVAVQEHSDGPLSGPAETPAVTTLRQRVLRTLPPIRRRDERIVALRSRVARLSERNTRLSERNARLSERNARLTARVDSLRKRAATLLERNEALSEKCAELEAEIARQKESESQPSFRRMLLAQLRLVTRAVPPIPRHGITHKLHGQAIARGQGVPTPAVLGQWDSLEEIDLDGMPDEFVLKSAGGATSRGVWPLRRRESGYELLGKGRIFELEELRETFRVRLELNSKLTPQDRIQPPYFVEEMLYGLDGDPIPVDVKVYAFYGKVGHVMLRRVRVEGGRTITRFRYLTPDGTDLGAVSMQRVVDETIPVPASLDEIVAAAEKLSRAARLPFVRVDLYETTTGIVFGEFTPVPGGTQQYLTEHDRLLGELWEDAQTRLDADVAAGMPLEHDLGGADHWSRPAAL